MRYASSSVWRKKRPANSQSSSSSLDLLGELRRERERREALIPAPDVVTTREQCKSLHAFVRAAWHVLEPTTTFVDAWHIDLICTHLTAVTEGKINRLLINVPPGSSKSLIVSVFWPAWEWGPRGKRSMRYVSTSYSDACVTRDTRKMRNLVQSGWYQKHWPVELVRTGETSFENVETGWREGSAFGSLTSKRGDRLLIDDPHSTEMAESEAERLRTTRMFREGATNRLNDQQRSAIVIIMQRLHKDDISGVIESLKMDYVHLRLPMEFEAERRCETPIGADPRRTDGDLLDPVRFPRETCEKLKRDMGSYAYAGQYQQRPTPREGGMFKVAWFTKIVKVAPKHGKRCRAWDLAGSVPEIGKDPSWTVGTLMCMTPEGFIYVEDVVRFRELGQTVRATILGTAQSDARKYGNVVRVRIPKDPAQAGKEQASSYIKMLAGFIVGADPQSGDKETRAEPFAVQCEAMNVILVDAPWNQTFIDELCAFPGGGHDDQVDSAAAAFNFVSRRWANEGQPQGKPVVAGLYRG